MLIYSSSTPFCTRILYCLISNLESKPNVVSCCVRAMRKPYASPSETRCRINVTVIVPFGVNISSSISLFGTLFAFYSFPVDHRHRLLSDKPKVISVLMIYDSEDVAFLFCRFSSVFVPPTFANCTWIID